MNHNHEHIEPKVYPDPTVDKPSSRELERMYFTNVAISTDGCQVEPDGICPHGHPSWLIRLGII